MMQLVSLILILWIVIYPVDSAIKRWNNQALMDSTIQLLNNPLLGPDEMHYNLAASPHACRLKTFNSIECPLMPPPNESEQGM